jgi:membrane-associated protein
MSPLMQTLIDLFLHLDTLLPQVAYQYGPWLYAMLFLVIFAETGLVVTPFLPGDSLLFAAGSFAGLGVLRLWPLFFLLCAAAILGDTVNYAIGRAAGWRAFSADSRFFKREHLVRTHAFYERHGGKTIRRRWLMRRHRI